MSKKAGKACEEVPCARRAGIIQILERPLKAHIEKRKHMFSGSLLISGRMHAPVTGGKSTIQIFYQIR
jgi:hypothetical protein